MSIVTSVVKVLEYPLLGKDQLVKVLVVNFLLKCHLHGILGSILDHEEMVFLILELCGWSLCQFLNVPRPPLSLDTL